MQMRTLAVAAVLILALVGCGSDGESSDSSGEAAESSASPSVAEDDLTATSYVASEVEGRELVPGSEILLVFELGTMTATAGCNIMFGDYEIDDDILRWSDAPARTQRACRDEAAAQDDWLTALLTAYGEGTGTQYWMSGSWHAVKTASASSSLHGRSSTFEPWRTGWRPRSAAMWLSLTPRDQLGR